MNFKKNKSITKIQTPTSIFYSVFQKQKSYLLTGLLILLFAAIIGTLVPSYYISNIQPLIKDIAIQLKSQSFIFVMLKIFIQNLMVCSLLILGGLLLLLPSLFILLVNGYTIGAAILITIQAKGVIYTISGIIPHGIFEIPAFLLAFSGAMYINHSIFSKNKINWREIGYLVSLVIILLAIAAIIETISFKV